MTKKRHSVGRRSAGDRFQGVLSAFSLALGERDQGLNGKRWDKTGTAWLPTRYSSMRHVAISDCDQVLRQKRSALNHGTFQALGHERNCIRRCNRSGASYRCHW